jgi:hypothetical protein
VVAHSVWFAPLVILDTRAKSIFKSKIRSFWNGERTELVLKLGKSSVLDLRHVPIMDLILGACARDWLPGGDLLTTTERMQQMTTDHTVITD